MSLPGMARTSGPARTDFVLSPFRSFAMNTVWAAARREDRENAEKTKSQKGTK